MYGKDRRYRCLRNDRGRIAGCDESRVNNSGRYAFAFVAVDV